MIDRLLDFLTGRAQPDAARASDELALAVTALMIEAARMDDDFDPAERATIERLLASRFDLAPAELDRLIASAERAVRQSTQFFPFTREICNRMAEDARVQIIEMLWKVAYADGVVDAQEEALLRRIAGLIDVSDRDRVLARRRALAEIAGLS